MIAHVDECDVRGWEADLLGYDRYGHSAPFVPGWSRVTDEDIAGAVLAPGVEFLYIPSNTPVLDPDEVRTPDLMTALTPRKEPLLLTAAPERAALPAPHNGPFVHAPYGLKANGEARKRPAPSPERVANMLAARGKAKSTAVVHLTGFASLDKIVGDIDREIERLQAARAAIVGAA
jgi:hypothetical protein